MISRRGFLAAAAAAGVSVTGVGQRLAFGQAAAGAPAVPPRANEVTVSAGAIDRPETIVTFPADPALAGSYPELAAEGGPTTPLQYTPDGRGVFVARGLKAGESRTYRVMLVKRSEAPADRAVADWKGGAVRVTADGRDVLIYRGEKTKTPAGIEPIFARGGYIHPLVTPGGVTVTDDYAPGHKHHHGVWAPWTATRFEDRKPDFWNMGQGSGTVEFVGLDKAWSGRVTAGFSSNHRFVDLSAKPDPKPALNETWRVDAYALSAGKDAPKFHLFDWQSTQTTASQAPLLLPKYYYGGLGVRGHAQWDGATNSQFLSSEGKTRKDGNETRGKWMAIYGKVDGKPGYIAVLCAPGNFRSPQPIRFHPKEPFMCYAPQQLGDFSIEPGKPYVMRYRFVVGDGEPVKADLDRLWEDYANPVKVEVR
ncbi:MAG TPA: PmoA family protein [Humisphaera sp.]